MDGGRKWSETTKEKREKERQRTERERGETERRENRGRQTEEREERQTATETIRMRDITLSERGRNNKQR